MNIVTKLLKSIPILNGHGSQKRNNVCENSLIPVVFHYDNKAVQKQVTKDQVNNLINKQITIYGTNYLIMEVTARIACDDTMYTAKCMRWK